jgi:phage terminase large subunit
MADIRIKVPHHYKPRSYQLPVFDAYKAGIKRFVEVWHRRSGKDTTALNFSICRMLERVGQYWHIFPTYAQGKKAIWEGFTRDGMPILDYFPPELVERKDNNDLQITLINGSIYRVVGSDQIDSLVGSNPIGLIFSEYSIQIPEAWELLAPILVENGGWAMFIFTPRGQNHAFKLAEFAKKSENWHFSQKSIDETRRDAEGEDRSPVVTPADLDDERARGADEDFIEQEYYCSFTGYRTGSYFGKEMVKADHEKRITSVPWEPRLYVFTVWDLGVSDTTAIWFFQKSGLELRAIDYYEMAGEGLPHYFKMLRTRPYVYSNHYAPHDIEVRELSSGKSRRQIAQEMGYNFIPVPNIPLADGIQNVRMTLPRFWFDSQKCAKGIQSLINYHREYNEKLRDYKVQPAHDDSSHGADAFRYACLIVDRENNGVVAPIQAVTMQDYEVFN